MTSLAAVRQGLEYAKNVLRPVLQVDRSLVDVGAQVVTWPNRVRGINRDAYYPLEYQFLLDRAQYSFLLTDSSFLQVYYQFEGAVLRAARLAYYPRPMRLNARAEDFLAGAESFWDVDEVMGDHLYNWYEAIEERRDLPLNTSHLRFDYDADVISHSKSHLQYGAIQDIRVSADHFPMPVSFIEAVADCLALSLDGVSVEVGHARNNSFPVKGTYPLVCLRTA